MCCSISIMFFDMHCSIILLKYFIYCNKSKFICYTKIHMLWNQIYVSSKKLI